MGEMRYAALGKSMELSKLGSLIKDSYIQFGEAIDAQIDVIGKVGDVIREIGENTTKSSIEMSFLKSVFTEKQIEEIKSNNSLMAFQGDTKKKSDSDLDYWQPVIYISSDEFAQLMEKLRPVMDAANIGDRKPYVEAIKALVRSVLPGITPKEMDEMGVSEAMALVSGVTIKTQSMSNRTLAQIKDEKVVKRDEFDGLIADFKNKYNKLKKIRENKYDFSVERNKNTWYWLPVEDLP